LAQSGEQQLRGQDDRETAVEGEHAASTPAVVAPSASDYAAFLWVFILVDIRMVVQNQLRLNIEIFLGFEMGMDGLLEEGK
jgi:hypothetical protein